MSVGRGWKSLMAIKKEASGHYGEPVVCDKLIPFLSEDIGESIESSRDESLQGKAGYDASYVGKKEYNGSVPMNSRYGPMDLLVAIALGAASNPTIVTDLYKATYTLDEDLLHSLTACFDKQVSVWEYAGCKVDSFTIRGEAGGPVEFEFGIAGKVLNVTSIINTAVTMAAAELGGGPVMMMNDLTVLIGDCENALVVGDEITVSGFELTIANNLRTDLWTNKGTIYEPIRNARREIDLTLNFGTYESDQYKEWFQNDVDLQCSLAFQRTIVGKTDPYKFVIKLGKIRISEYDPNVDGQEAIAPECSFYALRAKEENPTWATMTEELEVDVQNEITTNILT